MNEELKLLVKETDEDPKTPIVVIRPEDHEAYRYIWSRKKLGVYPKWLVIFGRSTARFIFKRFIKNLKLEVVLRGRGSRVKAAKISGVYLGRLRQDLPLRYADKVAVYVSITRRK